MPRAIGLWVHLHSEPLQIHSSQCESSDNLPPVGVFMPRRIWLIFTPRLSRAFTSPASPQLLSPPARVWTETFPRRPPFTAQEHSLATSLTCTILCKDLLASSCRYSRTATCVTHYFCWLVFSRAQPTASIYRSTYSTISHYPTNNTSEPHGRTLSVIVTASPFRAAVSVPTLDGSSDTSHQHRISDDTKTIKLRDPDENTDSSSRA